MESLLEAIWLTIKGIPTLWGNWQSVWAKRGGLLPRCDDELIVKKRDVMERRWKSCDATRRTWHKRDGTWTELRPVRFLYHEHQTFLHYYEVAFWDGIGGECPHVYFVCSWKSGEHWLFCLLVTYFVRCEVYCMLVLNRGKSLIYLKSIWEQTWAYSHQPQPKLIQQFRVRIFFFFNPNPSCHPKQKSHDVLISPHHNNLVSDSGTNFLIPIG